MMMDFTNSGQSNGQARRDDYYLLLDVSPEDDVKTVKASYRKLLRRLHPDMGDGGITDDDYAYLISLITEAKDVLSDPVRKAAYDSGLGMDVVRVQEEVVQAREQEDYEELVESVDIETPKELHVAWWRTASTVRVARQVGRLAGLLLAVVTGVTVYHIAWGWLFLLVPFLGLWWGYSRHDTKFNLGAWVIGLGISAWVLIQGNEFASGALGMVALAWLVWGLVMAVVLHVGYVYVTPRKRVWNYGLSIPSLHAEATGALLDKVTALPGAIVVHGLSTEVDGRVVNCDHAVMAGNKVAFINSVEVNAGSVRWDASGRSIVNNDRDFIDTDAAIVGRLFRDKKLEKAAVVTEFVFCHARNGQVEPAANGEGFPVLVDVNTGVDALVRWLMEDNDCAVSNKKVVENVWRNIR